MTAAPFLILDRLDKSFGDHKVLRALSLAVAQGEIVALLGPSGSGKTTALRTLAGFEAPDSGSIQVDGEDVTRLPPARRNFGMVFQHYALFPHLSVGENVAFGLDGRGFAKTEIARRVAEALALVDLTGYEDRRVGEISGGQQQRVALARALAPEPRVLLLDEPLSNLDPTLRERTRRELRAAIRRVGITTVLVTHEQEEAFDLSDRVAVLADGLLQQVGTPEELYERPATRFVAGFVGRSSSLAGIFRPGPEGPAVELMGGVTWPAVPAENLTPGENVELVMRPESLTLASGTGALAGEVLERRYGGVVTYYTVALDPVLSGGGEVEVLAAPHAARVGDTVAVRPLGEKSPAPRAFRRRSGV
jgi:ABC-type Fe3+/spermidine/putrescine transport system ATPase subunit